MNTISTVPGAANSVLVTPGVMKFLTRSVRSTIIAVVGLIVISAAGCSMVAHSENVTGVSLFQEGRYAEAGQRFQQAVNTDPNDADGYYNLAATYHRLGKVNNQPAELQQAESYYHLCLDKNPNHLDCHRGLAVLLVEENRPQDAFNLMQRWTEQSPGSAEPRIELARLFEEFGDKPAAMAHLQEAIALQPDNSRALAALGRLRENTGDKAQALAIYQRSLQANPNQPLLATRVAQLQTGGGYLPGVTAPDGTRTVATPVTPLR